MKTNMHISSKPVWWDIWSTPSSCDPRLFFSLGASRREPSISLRKKDPLEPRVFFLEQLVEQWKRRLCAHSFENKNRPMNTNQSKSKIFIDLEISEKTVKPMKAPKNSTWSYLNEISPHFITNGYDIIYVSLFLTLLNEIPLKRGSSRCALYHSNAMDFFVSCVSLYSWFSAVSLIPQLTLWSVGKCVSDLKLRDLA